MSRVQTYVVIVLWFAMGGYRARRAGFGTVPGVDGSRWRRAAAAATAAAVAAAAGVWLSSPSPSPVGEAFEVRVADGPGPARPTGVWAVGVVTDPTRAEALGSLLPAAWVSAVRGSVTASPSSGADGSVADAARQAAAAAGALAGAPVPGVPVVASGTSGSSGGLAYALAYLELATPGRLAPAPVAATGVVDADGEVSAVAGLGFKWAAARAAGAAVLLVPRGGDDGLAGQAADGPRVLEVSSVAEAVAALCVLGSDDALCTAAPPGG